MGYNLPPILKILVPLDVTSEEVKEVRHLETMPHGSGQPKEIQDETPVNIPSPEVNKAKKEKRTGLGNVAYVPMPDENPSSEQQRSIDSEDAHI